MAQLAPAIIVFERRPRWESELKRRLAGERLLVRPCRAPADALALAQSMPGSVVFIDLETRPDAGLRLLGELSSLRTGARPVVVARPADFELEWPARELGAAAFLSELVSGDELVDLCRRLVDDATTPARH